MLVAFLVPTSLLLAPVLQQPHTSTVLQPPRTSAVCMTDALPDSDEGWMTVLSPNQFAVLRQSATEPPGYSEGVKGELEFEMKKDLKPKYPQEGAYECVGCGSALYYARSKFNSGCGWPAFYDGVPGAIEERPDDDGMRIEIVCNKYARQRRSPTDRAPARANLSLSYLPRPQLQRPSRARL